MTKLFKQLPIEVVTKRGKGSAEGYKGLTYLGLMSSYPREFECGWSSINTVIKAVGLNNVAQHKKERTLIPNIRKALTLLEEYGFIVVENTLGRELRANDIFKYKLMPISDAGESKPFAMITSDDIKRFTTFYDFQKELPQQFGVLDLTLYIKSKVYDKRIYHGQSFDNLAKIFGRDSKTIVAWAKLGKELGMVEYSNEHPFTIVRNDIKQEPATIWVLSTDKLKEAYDLQAMYYSEIGYHVYNEKPEDILEVLDKRWIDEDRKKSELMSLKGQYHANIQHGNYEEAMDVHRQIGIIEGTRYEIEPYDFGFEPHPVPEFEELFGITGSVGDVKKNNESKEKKTIPITYKELEFLDTWGV